MRPQASARAGAFLFEKLSALSHQLSATFPQGTVFADG
jgi:hypothetical protein